MKKIYHTAIIDGGAAGLLTAVDLLRYPNPVDGSDIIILEKNDRVGKKLIATGNGQGNLTNEEFSEKNYYGNKEFINSFVLDGCIVIVNDIAKLPVFLVFRYKKTIL